MNNAKIFGSGSIAGGEYDTVSIHGSGKVTGDVNASVLSINGSGTVAGNAKVDQLNISGSGSVAGSLNGKFFRIAGSGKVGGQIQASEVKISGSFTCQDHIVCDRVHVNGSLNVYGDVEAEQFQSYGSFHVEGEIKADELNALLKRNCYAEQIEGEKISIRNSPINSNSFIGRLLNGLFWQKKNRLEVELIKGTDLYVEATEATMIRGEKIVIGPNCRIETVEYTDSIEIDTSAKVGSKKKIN